MTRFAQEAGANLAGLHRDNLENLERTSPTLPESVDGGVGTPGLILLLAILAEDGAAMCKAEAVTEQLVRDSYNLYDQMEMSVVHRMEQLRWEMLS